MNIIRLLPAAVLHTLLLFLPLVFTTSNDELFEFPKMLLVYIGAISIAVSFLLTGLAEKKWTIPRTPVDLPILLFLGSQLLSTIFSIDPHTSWYGYYSRFNGGLLSVLSYVVIFYGSIATIRKETLPSYLRSLLLGGVLCALYAFPEHFGVSPSCVLITGEFNADCWVQDVQTRVFGTLGQPNWLAAYSVILVPFTASALSVGLAPEGLEHKKIFTIRSLLYVACFLLFTSVLLFTKSRSGILGAGVALGLFCLLTLVPRPKQETHTPTVEKHRALLATPVFLISCFLILLLTIGNPVRDKIFSLLHLDWTRSTQLPTTAPAGTQLENGGSESGDIRKVVWTGAIRVWQRYPLLGSGVETFAYSYYKDRPREHNMLSEWDFLYNKAHNEFLNYLATTGALGLASYLLLIGSFTVLPIVWSYKGKNQPPLATRYFLLATASSLAGLSVSNFFGFSTVLVSLLTFVLPALAVISTQRHTDWTVRLPSWTASDALIKLSMTIVVFFGLYGVWNVYRMFLADRIFAQGKTAMSRNDVQTGVNLLQSAVDTLPDEPVFRDELAYTAARISYALATTGDSTTAAQLAQAAIDHSDLVLSRHQANVNYYKTRVRILNLLSEISPAFYDEANSTLQKARELSPTDPKLTYNQALIAKEQGDIERYEAHLKETIDLRPIDLQSQLDLAILYEVQKKYDEALRVYGQVIQLDPKNTLASTRIASISAQEKTK